MFYTTNYCHLGGSSLLVSSRLFFISSIVVEDNTCHIMDMPPSPPPPLRRIRTSSLIIAMWLTLSGFLVNRIVISNLHISQLLGTYTHMCRYN